MPLGVVRSVRCAVGICDEGAFLGSCGGCAAVGVVRGVGTGWCCAVRICDEGIRVRVWRRCAVGSGGELVYVMSCDVV